jgi:DnaA family protein
MKQLPLAIGMPPLPTFDDFVVTGGSDVAVQHLRALAASITGGAPAGVAPVYLWGPSGCGKTHLLRALAAAVRERGQGVGWLDATTAALSEFDAAWSLLVFDDCERLDAERQQAAFARFVQATGARTVVAAAGRLPPVDLPLRDDLRSRLGWGLVFALEPLPEAQARGVLQREARRRGLALPDEVVDYLLVRFARDLGHLMRLLERLDTFALVHKRALTVPLVRQMLAEEGAAA